MIATMGPAGYNYDETISTLRYASRAKNIKNKPKINEDPKDALIRQYQEEIQKYFIRISNFLIDRRLKQLLMQQGGDVVSVNDIVITQRFMYLLFASKQNSQMTGNTS